MTSERDGYSRYPQKPAAPRQGRNPWPWIIAVAIIAVVIFGIAVVAVISRIDRTAQTPQITVVNYEVTGAVGSVELAYWGANGGTRPETVTLPWSKEVTLEGEDAFFDVSARIADGSHQELACRVTANGATLVQDRTVRGSVGCMGRLNEQ